MTSDLNRPATKEDIGKLELQLKQIRKDSATKSDLNRFATKKYLNDNFPTKKDMEKYTTKKDLEKYATKKDMEKYATRVELTEAVDAILDGMQVMFDNQNKEMKRQFDIVNYKLNQNTRNTEKNENQLLDHEFRIKKLEGTVEQFVIVN